EMMVLQQDRAAWAGLQRVIGVAQPGALRGGQERALLPVPGVERAGGRPGLWRTVLLLRGQRLPRGRRLVNRRGSAARRPRYRRRQDVGYLRGGRLDDVLHDLGRLVRIHGRTPHGWRPSEQSGLPRYPPGKRPGHGDGRRSGAVGGAAQPDPAVPVSVAHPTAARSLRYPPISGLADQASGGRSCGWSSTARNRSPLAAMRSPMVRMVKASGRRSGSSSSSQSIGAETVAPAQARGLYGATSVLLIAFWV